jgi:hypothetical protein
MKLLSFLALFPFLLAGGVAAQAQTIVGSSLSSSNTGNFGNNGLTTLNGSTTGYNPVYGVSAGHGGHDLSLDGGNYTGVAATNQPGVSGPGPYAASPQTVNFVPGNTTQEFSFFFVQATSGGSVVLETGNTLKFDLGGKNLLVSEALPFAGTYSLNGVGVTGNAGSVATWVISNASLLAQGGQTLTFTSNVQVPFYGVNGIAGPIGFSATVVPEPSTWALMLGGFAGLAIIARRRISLSRV